MIFVNFLSFSQSLIPSCGSEPNEESFRLPQAVYSKLISSINTTTATQYVFNITFHILRNDDATITSPFDTYPVGEAELQQVMFMLNTNYNQFNIFFKYRGFDYIDNSTFTTVIPTTSTSVSNSYPNLVNYAIANGKYNINSFNMFITNITNNLGTAGFANLPGTDSFISRQWINNVNVIPHEIGHNFNLYHTFYPRNAPYQSSPGVWVINNFCNSAVENVTRVPGLNYNADIAGDFVIDTEAMPSIAQLDPQVDNATCLCLLPLTTPVSDCVGTAYNNLQLPIKNFLGSQLQYNCSLDNFTPGQGIRMRETIVASETATTGTNLNKIFLARTTVESLYQPFESITVLGDVASVTDDPTPGNGLSIVCRFIEAINYRFQKGFTYEFTNPSATILSANIYQIPSLSLSYIANIKVNQVDPTITHEIGPACTRGTSCQIEPYVGGKIVTTNFLGSNNYTVEALDEIKLKNPQLYENLMSNTYNIITKVTSSGAVDQKIIYKGN